MRVRSKLPVSTASNQTFAIFQSRVTVSGEIPGNEILTVDRLAVCPRFAFRSEERCAVIACKNSYCPVRPSNAPLTETLFFSSVSPST